MEPAAAEGSPPLPTLVRPADIDRDDGSETRPLFAWYELFTTRDLLKLHGAFALAVVLALIVGAVGPATFTNAAFDAYGCSGDGEQRHYGAPCAGGTELRDVGAPNSTVVFDNFEKALPLSRLNEYFQIYITPYCLGNASFDAPVRMTVSFEAASPPSGKVPEWRPYGLSVATERTIDCFINAGETQGVCQTLHVATITQLNYPYFRVSAALELPSSATNATVAYGWMRDVTFETTVVTSAFTSYTAGFRIAFGVLACFVFVFLCFRFGPAGPCHTCMGGERQRINQEHVWGLILAGTLILACDPFYGIGVLSYSYLIDIFSAVFSVVSDALLLLFWLTAFDTLRQAGEDVMTMGFLVPKAVLVSLFCLFELIAIPWTRARYALNLVMEGDDAFRDQIFPVILLAQISFFAIIIWIAYMCFVMWDAIGSRRLLQLRVYLLGPPTLLAIVSQVVLFFVGYQVYGRPSAVLFTYALVLRVAYTMDIVTGYWPIAGRAKSEAAVAEASQRGSELQSLIPSGPRTTYNPLAAVPAGEPDL
eukprot:Unigene3972_Nuclearia_a/m.12075 Unigene3972_Nuclearia_a/g.12075  ORF Unigene3972_Nuclearia_a/g.12075 Unigene3972_Nuclearia_a/m.12075 type:complete len:536 (+) Unigene3972_Nuclearia_a:3631-5238(+)